MDDVPNFVQIIANVGFSIGVTLYLLVRFEKKIDVLSETIGKLIDVIKNNQTTGGRK
ncbi:YvrJ family protein [Paenibacillus sp. FSL R7-0331]|uniref:YvrJ family protein n=1 Tax=Paenibacillus sp. FSL R7-0331 TaxID=1536773 RepID=UPI000AAF342A|nr:YvrJ family protein [Paenibacillus sp. FSL R7-0331]